MANYLFDVLRKKSVGLRHGFVIGRTQGELHFPSDRLLSAKHCAFYLEGTEFHIEDLKSSNQTFVNKKALLPGVRHKLCLGDQIEVGNQKFVFTNADQSNATVDADADTDDDVTRVRGIVNPNQKIEARDTLGSERNDIANQVGTFFLFWRWDASTRATAFIIFSAMAAAIWAYFPDLARPVLHEPKRLLAISVAIIFVTGFLFLFIQHLSAMNARSPGLKAIGMLVGVFGAIGTNFVLQDLARVPLKLDQNRIYNDCRVIRDDKNFEWCRTWITQNKNNAFFTLDADIQAQALEGLRQGVLKAKEQARREAELRGEVIEGSNLKMTYDHPTGDDSPEPQSSPTSAVPEQLHDQSEEQTQDQNQLESESSNH